MRTILIVEDDRFTRHCVKDYLEGEGYLVLEATNGKRMLDILERYQADIILLDLYLPDGMGHDFIVGARDLTDAPLIVVTGTEECREKVICLDRGADDYVQKPMDFDELAARIRANLRRYKPSSEAGIHVNGYAKDDIINFGNWTMDRRKYQIFDQDNKPSDLTIQEFFLLDALVQNAGRPLHREELCEAIREEGYVPTPRSIDVKITRLRKKIGDDAAEPEIIKTVRGIGYVFVADQNNK